MIVTNEGGKMMKKLVSFRFEEELVERLKKLSETTYIAQTKLVELAITEFIERKEKEGEVKCLK